MVTKEKKELRIIAGQENIFEKKMYIYFSNEKKADACQRKLWSDGFTCRLSGLIEGAKRAFRYFVEIWIPRRHSDEVRNTANKYGCTQIDEE